MKYILGYFYHVYQTTLHKWSVFKNVTKVVLYWDGLSTKDKRSLFYRSTLHDLSKYRWSEASYFSKVIFRLKSSEYGTKEYREMLDSIKPAILIHYSRNKHHPEHYGVNGYSKMSHIDKLEMVADWSAATKRHATGNILTSIDINQDRFGYTDLDKQFLLDVVEKCGL